MNKPFFWPVRVYYEDTDAGGVVYYANYLKFLERARTEWLRALGFEQDALREELGLLFVVAGVDIRYRRPARFNEQLYVAVGVEELGRSRVVFAQRVTRDAPDGELLVEATVRVACVQTGDFRPCPMPRPLADRIRS